MHTCLLRMSVQRSPIRGSGSGSKPDLASKSREDAFVSQRKQKLPNMEIDINIKLQKYRQDMVSLLEKSSEKQVAQLIREELAGIKTDMRCIKTMHENLIQENNKLRNEVSNQNFTYNHAGTN